MRNFSNVPRAILALLLLIVVGSTASVTAQTNPLVSLIPGMTSKQDPLPDYIKAATFPSSTTHAARGRIGEATTFSVSRSGSDYYVSFSWGGLRPINQVCACGTERATIFVGQGSFISSVNWFSLNRDNNRSNGTYEYAAGPGVERDFYPRALYRGKYPTTVFGCTGPTGEGTCYEETRNAADDADRPGLGAISGATDALYPPENVTATVGNFSDRVNLTWEKGTDAPDFDHGYRITRDGEIIDNLPGSARSYSDTGRPTNEDYDYVVSTVYGSVTSAAAAVTGATFSLDFSASDGTKYNSTSLQWTSMAQIAEEIRIERAPPGGAREELAVLSKNARGYNDTEGVPGFEYVYYITPINSIILPASDAGYSRPDGVIKGSVKSSLGAGVSGVDITAVLSATIPMSSANLPSCFVDTYCTTTDENGFYEIRDIYYHEVAKFTVTPVKDDGTTPHEFSPATQSRTLDLTAKQSVGVDFTDLTVFTVGGTVAYPESSNFVTCGVNGVTILINGDNFGIKTDRDGKWSFALQDEGVYSFKPVFLHHAFENAAGIDSTELTILDDNLGIDFENRQTDTLVITAQGGCNSSLGDMVRVRVSAPDNCFNQIYELDVNGVLTITDLPARNYEVQVTEIISTRPDRTNIEDQIGLKKIKVDLTLRDTVDIITEAETTTIIPEITAIAPNDSLIVVQEADTILAGTLDTMRSDVKPSVSFIYRSPLDISVDFTNAGALQTTCKNSEDEDIVVMEQGNSYILDIEVKELLGTDCYVDTGFLKIYDFVSDRGGKAVRLPIKNGRVFYQVDAGDPVIATNAIRNHEKLIYVVPEVDLITPVPVEWWVLVTGSRSNTPSFITRTPDIPMLILHDPPGDNSYAYVERGTSFENFTTNETLVGGDAGGFANLLLGAKILTPFSGNGFGTIIKFQAEAGRDNFDRNGIRTTMTFTENFSTSSLQNITGRDGDVYIGAAYNQEFSLAETLLFDPGSCAATVDVIPSLAAQTFATTFVYTELHIKNTLLPTFGFLRSELLDDRDFATLTVDEQAEVNNLISDSLMWEQILAKNDKARFEDAAFQENISFSAGAPISREYETDTVTSVSYEYNSFVNTEFAVGAKIDNESGIWFDSELGVMGKFRWATTVNTGNDTTKTRKVGYVFDDGDIGDFFSVDIFEDKSYAVPSFDLKVGTTSCPQEAGSQARDRPLIEIFPPEINDVPADGTANFVCQITNDSESRETREYHVRAVSSTNPDGAVIALGGFGINNKAASFFLNYGETLNLNLSVKKGPLASNYKNIGIMVYPPCEYELWQDNGVLKNADTADIVLLNFETLCTNVTLRNPLNGWLINKNSPPTMRATFSGYDLNNESFEELSIELKRVGQGYIEILTIPKEDLLGANTDVQLDLSNFPDGNYVMRARAYCNLDGVTYSSELNGIIDRQSLAPFGYPTPSDGFLRPGQNISVTFDKPIECTLSGDYVPTFSLVRDDTNEAIPVTASCSGDKIILTPNVPLSDVPDLQGVSITALVDNLRDESGNEQEYPTQWSFLVNVTPVFWDPSPVLFTGMAGEENSLDAILKNDSDLSKAFSLDLQDASGVVSYPEWLTTVRKNGTILPSDDEVISFAIDPELTAGIYRGDITALVGEEAITTEVVVELLAQPVNWPFDASDYEFSMTLVTTFSLNNTDNLLSTNERDLVGAFVNGEIRGVANLEYLPTVDLYRAFLTIYSNELGGNNGEEITFRFWHALNGVEYGAQETIRFSDETNVGSATDPLILHPEGIFQIIPLRVGWNWISLNVETDDMSREHLLGNLLGAGKNNGLILKSQDEIAVAQPNNATWNGDLLDLELGTGYLLYLSSSPDTLKVVGLPSPDPIRVRVTRNWNWIGYPQLEQRPVADVLADLNLRKGDILRNDRKFTTFDTPATGWLGNLTQFMPGNSYKLNVRRNGNIDFPAPKRSGYSVDPGIFEHNMSVIGTFDLTKLNEESYKPLDVVAFIDGECRGIGRLEYCPTEDGYRTFMLVHGNEADYTNPIEFRIVNTETRMEYLADGETQIFGADRRLGTVPAPYPYLGTTVNTYDPVPVGYALHTSIPNPATALTTIGFRLPASEPVSLQLFNVNGELVRSLPARRFPAGENSVQINVSGLQSGVYVYRLQTDGFSASRKLIVQ